MLHIANAVHVEDFYRLAPIFVACFFGILIMVLDPFVPERSKIVLARLGVFGGLAALFPVLLSAGHMGRSYTDARYANLIQVDEFSIFMFLGIFTFAVLTM